MKTCAILTCHNRRDQTIKCIESVFRISPDIHVFAVDDGSNDGTADALRKLLGNGRVIKGSGQLFWSRGMALAWEAAMATGEVSYDFTLWLNDDIELLPSALDELFECSHAMANGAVITGLVKERTTGATIYGGSSSDGRLLQESGNMEPVAFMNGNCVLVPRGVSDSIGTIDPTFHHDLGDVDYGLRAIRAGYRVFTTRNIVAVGEQNEFCRVRKPRSSIAGRFRKLYSPLGSPPYLNFLFRKRHYGVFNAAGYYIFLHILNLLPDKLCTSIFGNRYS